MSISLIEGAKFKQITKMLKKSFLFADMNESEIEKVITCSGATIKIIDKNEIIFNQEDIPKYLFVLLGGAVAVCKDSISGKRGIVTLIEQSGDIFGEIYLFLPKNKYDFYTLVTHQAEVMMIPREFFSNTCSNQCNYHSKLIENMLGILSQKAYYLGQKLQILSSGSLRQKIAKYLLDNCDINGFVNMKMNREVFADYLIVARPSLSREILRMQDEGLIEVNGKNIKIVELDSLEAEL